MHAGNQYKRNTESTNSIYNPPANTTWTQNIQIHCTTFLKSWNHHWCCWITLQRCHSNRKKEVWKKLKLVLNLALINLSTSTHGTHLQSVPHHFLIMSWKRSREVFLLRFKSIIVSKLQTFSSNHYLEKP